MKNGGEEEILDIQKSYSEEIIQEIQHALDAHSAIIKTLSCIDELPKMIYMDGVKLTLTFLNNRYDTCMYFIGACINNEYIKKWKTEPIYAFLYKDWKRLNKDVNIFDNENYLELTFNVGDAQIISLLRRVDTELADNSFALMEYGDIYYNNAQYAIIKSFSPTIEERYDTMSKLENDNTVEKLYDSNGIEVILGADGKYNMAESDTDNISANDIPDPESEELF